MQYDLPNHMDTLHLNRQPTGMSQTSPLKKKKTIFQKKLLLDKDLHTKVY